MTGQKTHDTCGRWGGFKSDWSPLFISKTTVSLWQHSAETTSNLVGSSVFSPRIKSWRSKEEPPEGAQIVTQLMYSGRPRHTSTNPRTPLCSSDRMHDRNEALLWTASHTQTVLFATQKREATQNHRKSQIEFESKVSAELSAQKSEISQKKYLSTGRRRPCRDPCGVSGKMVSCKKKLIRGYGRLTRVFSLAALKMSRST